MLCDLTNSTCRRYVDLAAAKRLGVNENMVDAIARMPGSEFGGAKQVWPIPSLSCDVVVTSQTVTLLCIVTQTKPLTRAMSIQLIAIQDSLNCDIVVTLLWVSSVADHVPGKGLWRVESGAAAWYSAQSDAGKSHM